MPVMRVSDATWDRLQSWAVPLGGSVDDAVRRVLDVAERQVLPPPRTWLERYLRESLVKDGASQRRAAAQAKRMARVVLDSWETEVWRMARGEGEAKPHG